MQDGLADCVEKRIAAGAISLDHARERAALLQQALWSPAEAAAREAPNPVQSGLFIQSLDEMFDAYDERNAALDRHVPEVVRFLLFGTFALTAFLVGYASGISGHRATFATYVLVVLISFLVFIVIDLDRPRRGLIEVSQQSLLELGTDATSRWSGISGAASPTPGADLPARRLGREDREPVRRWPAGVIRN